MNNRDSCNVRSLKSGKSERRSVVCPSYGRVSSWTGTPRVSVWLAEQALSQRALDRSYRATTIIGVRFLQVRGRSFTHARQSLTNHPNPYLSIKSDMSATSIDRSSHKILGSLTSTERKFGRSKANRFCPLSFSVFIYPNFSLPRTFERNFRKPIIFLSKIQTQLFGND